MFASRYSSIDNDSVDVELLCKGQILSQQERLADSTVATLYSVWRKCITLEDDATFTMGIEEEQAISLLQHAFTVQNLLKFPVQ
jgi:hypothetical protein